MEAFGERCVCCTCVCCVLILDPQLEIHHKAHLGYTKCAFVYHFAFLAIFEFVQIMCVCGVWGAGVCVSFLAVPGVFTRIDLL